MISQCCLKKNQNTPRPSEHPPVMGEKMSKRLGGIKRLQIQNLFMAFKPVPRCRLLMWLFLTFSVLVANPKKLLSATKIKARTAEGRWIKNPVGPSFCVTPAGTSNELDVQNGWEENTHTHTRWPIPLVVCWTGKREQKKKSGSILPPPTPHTARSEKIDKITRRIYRRYAGLGRSRVRTKIPSARRLGLWVWLRKILHSRLR